jgi:hypothetical protein
MSLYPRQRLSLQSDAAARRRRSKLYATSPRESTGCLGAFERGSTGPVGVAERQDRRATTAGRYARETLHPAARRVARRGFTRYKV